MSDDVFRDHDRGIHQHADGDGDAGQRHDVAGDPELLHQQERHKNRDRQREGDDEDAAEVPQENDVGQGDEDDLLDQRVLERADGIVDQLAAVVERLDGDALGQARRDEFELLLHPLDHRLGIFAGTHHDGATDRFLAVDVERPAPEIAADLDGRDVFQVDWRALHRLHRHEFQILLRSHEPDATQHEFRAVLFDDFSSHVEVGVLNRGHYLHQRHVRRAHLRRGELDLVLLHEAADARDFRDALNAGELVAEVPILERAEFREIIAAVLRFGGIDIEVVLIDPTEARRVRTELRRDASGHRALQEVQPLQHPGPGEVGIDAILEDDGHQREAEHRGRAHLFHPGLPLQSAAERKGHLVLHLLRAAAHEVGIHQHLVLGQVRDGIDRRELHGADAQRDDQQRGAEDDEAVLEAPLDNFLNHGRQGWISLPHSSISAPKYGLWPGRSPSWIHRPFFGASGIA